jgi:ribosomal protein S6
MSETQMPAAEANEAVHESDTHSYELAFHILPTVAEGEVQGVFDSIKTLITNDGGVLFDEEAPQRFELAYGVVKNAEGKNRTYTTAYFGWIRFKAEGESVVKMLEEVSHNGNILRHILIKLSKVEEAHPFRFHESIESFKMVTTIDEADLATEDLEDVEVVPEEVKEEVAVLEK